MTCLAEQSLAAVEGCILASSKCQDMATVNFLHVYWAVDCYSGKESVINKSNFMNQKNIYKQRYSFP